MNITQKKTETYVSVLAICTRHIAILNRGGGDCEKGISILILCLILRDKYEETMTIIEIFYEQNCS